MAQGQTALDVPTVVWHHLVQGEPFGEGRAPSGGCSMQVSKRPGCQPPPGFTPTRQPHTYARRWVVGPPAASDSEGDTTTDGTLGDSSKRGELSLTGSSVRRGELGTSWRRAEFRAEKEKRDKAAALRTIFHGRSAEAILHTRSRTGDAVVLRKKQRDLAMESIDSMDRGPQLAASRSTPSLRYLEREPTGFAERRRGEAAWQARRLLRGLYRQEIENQGCTFGIPRKWPPPQDAMVDEDKFKTQPMARTVYAPQPFVVAPANMDVTLLKPEEPVPRDPNPPSRRAAMQQLRNFGASCGGAPYTLSQVYEEISAKLDHRKPRDLRSAQGTLGPQELGAGTTLDRRELPFIRSGSRVVPGKGSPPQSSISRAAIQDAEPENGLD